VLSKKRMLCLATIGWFFADISNAIPREPKRFIFNVVDIQRKGERSWWGEVLTLQFAPEQLQATRKAGEIFGFSGDDAVKFVQLKRNLINEVSRKEGEEETGIFRSPDRYTFCRADMVSFDPKFQEGPSDTTFNVRALHRRDTDGLGYYIVAPISWQGTEVKATLRITFVLADVNTRHRFSIINLIKSGKCYIHNSCPWVCRNNQCTRDLVGCDPDDHNPDRWLVHDY
jgi:hypothetical protein